MIFRWAHILLFVFFAGKLFAGGPPDADRFYAPLDKLSQNPLILSRDKSSQIDKDDMFPFLPSQFSERMMKIVGFPFDDQMQYHLTRMTGIYSTKALDALGVFAEIDSLVSAEFTTRKVPLEYKLLAPMLSGMNVQYEGPQGKRGIWQLDVITAVKYGLIVSETRDDRDDPFLSTPAAAKHLHDLISRYKTTETVLWAYISSPAEVMRAYTRAQSAKLEAAKPYLPVYLQHSRSIFASWLFVWTYFSKENLPQFIPSLFTPYESVNVPSKTHIGQISEVMDIPLNLLKELNPSLKTSIVKSSESIYLPKGKAKLYLPLANTIASFRDTFYFQKEVIRPAVISQAENKTVQTTSSTEKKYHVVKSGETLSHISGKYKVSVALIKKWNNLRSNTIRTGQKLVVKVTVRVPVRTDKEDKTIRENVVIEQERKAELEIEYEYKVPENPKTPEPAKPQPKPAIKEAWIYYTVKSGDTLYSIGRKYGVAHTKIKEWNKLRSDNIQIGQKLKVKK